MPRELALVGRKRTSVERGTTLDDLWEGFKKGSPVFPCTRSLCQGRNGKGNGVSCTHVIFHMDRELEHAPNLGRYEGSGRMKSW